MAEYTVKHPRLGESPIFSNKIQALIWAESQALDDRFQIQEHLTQEEILVIKTEFLELKRKYANLYNCLYSISLMDIPEISELVNGAL